MPLKFTHCAPLLGLRTSSINLYKDFKKEKKNPKHEQQLAGNDNLPLYVAVNRKFIEKQVMRYAFTLHIPQENPSVIEL